MLGLMSASFGPWRISGEATFRPVVVGLVVKHYADAPKAYR